MEDGVKGSSDTPPSAHEAHKAGWLKKSSGGLLGLWKERYIVILRTQLLVCEAEDEKKCIETLELANYERCQDQKSFLKRKKHFMLIPSPGSKVQDVKFQAKNVEERDTWIQALNDGINRGKNKIFDEVTVDESCALEHVTRDRVKIGAAKRRPPTRIHLKEVAEAVSDGSSRLELDTLDSGAPRAVTPVIENVEPQQQKEPVKIPMPPLKQCPSTSTEELNTTDSNHPPSPPSKVLKESVYAREKLLSEDNERERDENKPDSENKESLGEILNSPPKPPPKILSDKMKIMWVGSSSDVLDKGEIKSDDRGSKENLVEFDSDELRKSPIPPLKVRSNETKIPELNHSRNSLEVESTGESLNLAEQKHEPKEITKDLSENIGAEEILAKQDKEDNKELKNEDNDDNKERDVKVEEQTLEKKKPQVLRTLTPIMSTTVEITLPVRKPRASSMGDLLSEDNETTTDQKSPFLHLTKDHLNQVEVKLARGRERTETLLNRVLQGELVKSIEGNGPDVNAEALLNEAVKQLREASEVLQEIKVSTILPHVSDAEKEKQKDLLTLYRRSLP